MSQTNEVLTTKILIIENIETPETDVVEDTIIEDAKETIEPTESVETPVVEENSVQEPIIEQVKTIVVEESTIKSIADYKSVYLDEDTILVSESDIPDAKVFAESLVDLIIVEEIVEEPAAVVEENKEPIQEAVMIAAPTDTSNLLVQHGPIASKYVRIIVAQPVTPADQPIENPLSQDNDDTLKASNDSDDNKCGTDSDDTVQDNDNTKNNDVTPTVETPKPDHVSKSLRNIANVAQAKHTIKDMTYHVKNAIKSANLNDLTPGTSEYNQHIENHVKAATGNDKYHVTANDQGNIKVHLMNSPDDKPAPNNTNQLALHVYDQNGKHIGSSVKKNVNSKPTIV